MPPSRDSEKEGLPLFARPAFAGFPSPADDFVEKRVDLNEHLVRHKEATFFLRVQGDCMEALGIRNEDLLVVDRSLTAKHGDVVVAIVDGRLTVKQLWCGEGQCILRAADRTTSDVFISQERELILWGVVCWSIHRL